jgi:serine/threonine-protein kinase
VTVREALERLRHPPAPPSAKARGARDDRAARARGFADPVRHAAALRGELDAIVSMAMRHEPDRRYPTVDALADDVKRFLRGDRVLARPESLGYRLRRLLRRQRGLAAGATLGVLALLAGSAAALWQARLSRAEAERAERIAAFMGRLFSSDDAGNDELLRRVGSQGTVAQLLDSMVRRVPTAFADDPRIRARLYTTIGAQLFEQNRLREARTALDSGLRLARIHYGERSALYATASHTFASAILNGEGPAAAEPYAVEAVERLRPNASTYPLRFGRAALALASVRFHQGRVRDADSIARAVLASERARSAQPTPLLALAAVTLAQSGTWLSRDPRRSASLYADVVRLSDALGTPLAIERLFALQQWAEAATVLGRLALADSLL